MRRHPSLALPLSALLISVAAVGCSSEPEPQPAPGTATTVERLSAGALLAVTPVNSVAMLTVAPQRAALAVTGGQADLVLANGVLHLGSLEVDLDQRALPPDLLVHDIHLSLDAPVSAAAVISAGRVSADLPATMLLDCSVDSTGQPGKPKHDQLATTLHIEVTTDAAGRTNAAVTATATHEFAGKSVALLLAIRAID